MQQVNEFDPERLMPGYKVGAWEIDTTHSEVSFSIWHTLIWLRGRFLTVNGTIETPENPLESRVEASIDPASFSTGLELRDNKIKTFQDFLWVEKFPEIKFKSKGLAATAKPNEFVLKGDLTVMGVTKAVDLQLAYHGIARYELYGTRIGFSATTQLDRRDFGVSVETPRVESVSRLPDDGRLLGRALYVNLQIEAVLTTDRGKYKP